MTFIDTADTSGLERSAARAASPNFGIDQWALAGGTCKFSKAYGQRAIECSVTVHHQGNYVSATFIAPVTGDAFYGAIAAIEKTVGSGWRVQA